MINEKVKSGLYNSASEVVRASLRLLKEQDEVKRMRLEALKREVQLAVDQMDRGEGLEYDSAETFFAEVVAEGTAELASENQLIRPI